MKILLVNNNPMLPYKEQYRLFDTWPAAHAAAKELGWTDAFGMGLNKQVGFANIERCGGVNLTLIAVEEER